MPVTISDSVGKHRQTGVICANKPEDVIKVQTLLRVTNRLVGVPSTLVQEDGLFGAPTEAAITEFQQARLGSADGVVEPNQRTLDELNAIAASPVEQVLQNGDTTKVRPYTILFIANPALEAPWNSGTFVVDPVYLIPGTVALHTTSSSLTPLHEFGHAASSYSNGSVTDLYVDSPPALNNKRGRPIPGSFANYAGSALASDSARDGIGYPASWQSYHCELHDAALPAVMDDYWLASTGAGGPEACQHDKITRAFLRDRILAKMSR